MIPEDGGGERTIYFLGIDILELPVEDEVVAFGAQINSRLLAQQDEGEDVAVLLAAAEEEAVGVNTVGYGAANVWNPVEYDPRLVCILDKELALAKMARAVKVATPELPAL
jgi:hypothetical protein